MWKILNMPFKIATLDEVQRVNKRGKLHHHAFKKHLHESSFLVFSGRRSQNESLKGESLSKQDYRYGSLLPFIHILLFRSSSSFVYTALRRCHIPLCSLTSSIWSVSSNYKMAWRKILYFADRLTFPECLKMTSCLVVPLVMW